MTPFERRTSCRPAKTNAFKSMLNQPVISIAQKKCPKMDSGLNFGIARNSPYQAAFGGSLRSQPQKPVYTSLCNSMKLFHF